MKDDTTTPPNGAGAQDLPLPNLGILEHGGQKALDAWLQSNEALVKGTLDIAQQMLSFGQKRLDDDLSTLRSLMACHDFNELAECQKQFAEKAATQYMAQASTLTTKLTSLIANTAAATHPAA
jgi:hypothetical protein